MRLAGSFLTVCLGAVVGFAFASVADANEKSALDISGVWAVYQVITASGQRSAVGDPPMSEQGKALVAAFRDQFNLEGMEPNAHCVEPGMPTVMFGIGNQPIEIIQQQHRVTILSEVGMQIRRIFMDGRPHPENYPHTRNGHSIAHWEGDTLVVETTLIEEWLMPRWAHTGDARIVERFSLIKSSEAPRADRGNYRDFGPLGAYVLVDELTMYDPVIYSTPPSIRVYYRRLRDDEFLEHSCPEGLWWEVMETLRKPQMSSVTLTGQ
jgi:hypothetical protein